MYNYQQVERIGRLAKLRIKTMNTITIVGIDYECRCEICGRDLKAGVVTAEKGTVGADCFVKTIVKKKQHSVK